MTDSHFMGVKRPEAHIACIRPRRQKITARSSIENNGIPPFRTFARWIARRAYGAIEHGAGCITMYKIGKMFNGLQQCNGNAQNRQLCMHIIGKIRNKI